MESALYPIQNKYRFNTLMNSTWKFETDPNSVGLDERWNKELPDPEEMPVPVNTILEIFGIKKTSLFLAF